jgi:hypothetical protein
MDSLLQYVLGIDIQPDQPQNLKKFINSTVLAHFLY